MSRDPFRLLGLVVEGKYRVEGVLGEGGNGVVYAATQLALSQPVALKCLKLAPDGASDADVARFTREARVLFQLSHPGIVRMYDVGEVATPLGHAPYVVLERVDGQGLDEAIRARAERRAAPFTAAEILAVFDPLLEALAFAHARGVVHRDMKPSNVMVLSGAAGLSAKILDFGTARAGSSGLATTGAGGLTPRYAAPEQWNANYGSVGPTTDLFAVGLMLEEACTLDFALAGTTLSELVAAATSPSRSTRVAFVRPDLAALAPVVARATAVSPAARFASAAAMRDAVRDALAGAGPPRLTAPPVISLPPRVSISSPPGAAVSAPPAGPTAVSPAAHTVRQPEPRRSGAGWAIAALAIPALLALVALAGGAGWYVRSARTATSVGPAVPPAATGSAISSASAAAPTASAVATSPVVASTPSAPAPSAPGPARSGPRPSSSPSGPPPTAPTAPSAPSAPSQGRKLVYTSSSPTYGNLYPAQAEFVRVVDTYAPGLQRCFLDERVADSWTITITVNFARGRSLSAMIVHEGTVTGTSNLTAERLRDCAYNAVLTWPWPAAPPQGPDAGAPYVRFFVGMVWQGTR